MNFSPEANKPVVIDQDDELTIKSPSIRQTIGANIVSGSVELEASSDTDKLITKLVTNSFEGAPQT